MPEPTRRSWGQKFADAFRGLSQGTRGQSSFVVHLAATAGVIALAAWLHVSLLEWCVLVMCIAAVLTAELFNSALEWMAKAIDSEHNEQIGGALDIASGAVLTAAIGAATVGAIVFGNRLLQLLS